MNIFKRANSEGKQQTLKNWCDDTWPIIYRYAYRFVQNREEAEDITQETYLRALKKLNSSDNPPTNGYLKTIALNLIRDRWRRSKNRGNQVPLEDYILHTESTTDQTDTKALVEELMAKLSEDYRIVLQLRIVQGFSRTETAIRMGRTEDSIRGLQYRAAQALKKLFEEHLRR